jgi:hypothetical protein
LVPRIVIRVCKNDQPIVAHDVRDDLLRSFHIQRSVP